MATNGKEAEKQEKEDEKEQGKQGKGAGKYQKDPLGGVFFGLVLITVGGIFIGKDYLPDPGLWWAWVLVGIGIVSFLDAAARWARPEWKRPIFGKIVLGVILIVIGGGFIFQIEMSWAVILLVIGALMLLYYIRGIYKE